MSDECVVAVYKKLDDARKAVRELSEGGFPTPQISLVTAGLKDHPDIVEELQFKDDSMHDAAVLAGLGGIAGALAGLSVIVASGLGVVFLVGPIGGAIAGAVTGGFMGAMGGWGVHDHQIQHYERLIAEGHVLVVANGAPLDLARAHRVLEWTNTEELHTYARSDDEVTMPTKV